ncbi:MAG TPA: HD domain-containing protein [Candidatus Norongarragalinales archaeon]|nr:HD domain-containing protein [Candidatus Norongarragalinales archaeon]
MSAKKPDLGKLADFIFETGDLKFIKRSGWWHARVSDPESVAEHSFRTALIAYLLARLARHPLPERISFLALIHDLPESRLLDLHKISAGYVENKGEIEKRILQEQQALAGFDFPTPSPTDAILVKDADLLEMAFTAKEYMEAGHENARILFNEAKRKVRLPASKRFLAILENKRSTDWLAAINRSSK